MHDKRKPRLALVLDLPGLIMDDPSHGTGAQLKELAQKESTIKVLKSAGLAGVSGEGAFGYGCLVCHVLLPVRSACTPCADIGKVSL